MTIVTEAPTQYLIELDVSEFAPPELDVSTEGNRVDVVGEHVDADAPVAVTERLHERFTLPDDADPERVYAYLAHGVLEIHAPRRSARPHRHVPVVVKANGGINPDATPC